MQLSQPSRNDASSSSDPAQSDPNVTVVSSDIVVAVAANNGDGTSHEITPAVEGAIAGPSVDSGGPTECIICLTEMDDSGEDPTRTLVCGHRFHTACVSEWLSKDGRCPTCRHQIQEVAARQVPPVLAEGVLGDINASRASMHAMAMLMLESRRLMMLATMEAALAVSGAAPPPGSVPPGAFAPSGQPPLVLPLGGRGGPPRHGARVLPSHARACSRRSPFSFRSRRCS